MSSDHDQRFFWNALVDDAIVDVRPYRVLFGLAGP